MSSVKGERGREGRSVGSCRREEIDGVKGGVKGSDTGQR